MVIVNAVKEFFTRYVDFKGRTSRATYWWTILGLFILGFIIGFVSSLIFGAAPTINANTNIEAGEALKIYFSSATNVISFIISLITIIPGIAMSIRRLHDINKSGWFYLLSFIPFIGQIILLVFYCMPTVDEGNNY